MMPKNTKNSAIELIEQLDKQLHQLLPLRQLIIDGEITTDTRPQYFHQTSIPAWIFTLLNRLPPEKAKTAFRLHLPKSGNLYYPKGSPYRFAITTFNGGETYLPQLITALTTPSTNPDRRTWHNNFRLTALKDGYTQQTITTPEELSQYTPSQLQTDCDTLAQAQSIELLIETGIAFGQSKVSASDLDSAQLLLQLAISIIYALSSNQADQTRQVQNLSEHLSHLMPAEPFIHDSHLFYLNKTYADSHGKYKYLSGYHGSITLTPYQTHPHAALINKLLILCQYLGIGKRCNYGIGQYRLIADGQTLKKQPPPSQTLLSKLLSIETLCRSPEYADAEENEKTQLRALAQDIISGSYIPSPMQSFTQTRTSLSGQTKTRTLHTAPPQERLLQKIVARGLSERLDNMQHPASYGYRPKRSRQMAVKALKKRIEQNRPWILESDIADCFDSIPHSIIRSRLASLINDDITTDFILRVISAPRQNTITGIGIPQGSPLSPLLANIVLSI